MAPLARWLLVKKKKENKKPYFFFSFAKTPHFGPTKKNNETMTGGNARTRGLEPEQYTTLSVYGDRAEAS